MVMVTSGKDVEGKPCEFYLDGYLKRVLDVSITRVKKGWDYVAIVSGLSGSGKSTFARTAARYCCPWFDLNYIAFSDNEFIEMTKRCPRNSAIVLDESFQSLNSRVTMSKPFLKIVNHLQIIRQKNLYIFLCLPNYFDLSKGVAIFRSSHLFVTYASSLGERGRVMAFGRKEKRLLYVLGSKYMNYNAVRANFRASFRKNSQILDEEEYERKKINHLQAQQQKLEKQRSIDDVKQQERMISAMRNLAKLNWKHRQIARLFDFTRENVTRLINLDTKSGKNADVTPLLG